MGPNNGLYFYIYRVVFPERYCRSTSEKVEEHLSPELNLEVDLLAIKRLTKSFGSFRAVNELDLDVEEGELRCIIGPNGAGKTTLFNLISGSLRPDYGSIRYRGKDITRLRPHERAARGIIRKFQVPNIYWELTLRDNIRIPAQVSVKGKISPVTRSCRDVEIRIDEILELTGLVEKKNEIAGKVSHGERQWLELGMALAMRPKLMLLDEPTAGMTAAETNRTAGLIERLSEVTTIIVIEHDINFIKRIAQKITVMHLGSVLTEGSLKEIENNEKVRDVYLGKGNEYS